MNKGQIFIVWCCTILGCNGLLSDVVASSGTVSRDEVLKKSNVTVQDDWRINFFYYKYPQPDKIIAHLRMSLSDPVILDNYDAYHDNLFYLYAVVASHDQEVLRLVKQMQQHYTGRELAILRNLIDEAEKFETLPPSSLINLRRLYYEFLATGDKGILQKILTVYDLPLNDPYPYATMAIIEEAHLTFLTLISAGHAGVFELVKDAYDQSQGQKKLLMGKIFEALDKEKKYEDFVLREIGEK